MSDKLLFANKFKKIGWFILIPTSILGIILIVKDFEFLQMEATVFAIFNDEIFEGKHFFKFIKTDITNTIAGILFLIGSILVGFSREKKEDEFIANLRQTSLLWAVFVNSVLLLLAFIFIYGMAFLNVMIYNMFTVLIIFIGRFNYILFKSSKMNSDEK